MGIQVLNGRSNAADKCTNSHAFDANQQAMEWNKCVDSMKFSLDKIYEMCWETQNMLACKEILLYLTNAIRDFQSLISSINVEVNWENRPQAAIAWELSGASYSKPVKSELNGTLTSLSNQPRSKRRIKENDSSDEDKLRKTVKCVSSRDRIVSRYDKKRSWLQALRPTYDYAENCDGHPANQIVDGQNCVLPCFVVATTQEDPHGEVECEETERTEHCNIGNRRRSLPVLTTRVPNPPTEPNLESIHEEEKNETGEMDDSSIKTHCHFTRSDPRGYALEMLDLNNDDEWHAMTEEELSLAQEEESLQKEIEEEESISIDEELQRRVILDFGDVDMTADHALKKPWRTVVDEWTIEDKESYVQLVDASSMTEPDCRFRRPGAAAEVHQRLMSPSRRRNLDVDGILERQNKAEELRLMLQESKSRRLRELHLRVEEVRKKREEILEKKRVHMTVRMDKAIYARQKNLDEIVKKAKDDNSKVLEINFINSIEAETARVEAQLLAQEREERLTLLAEERARLARDKASSKAAADERRRLVDQQRADWLREESNKTKERQLLAETQRLEMLESYRQRMKLRGQKLEERRSQEATENRNLQCKIFDKHVKSSKRHDESVAQVRQKAVESSTLKTVPSWVMLAESQFPPSDSGYPDGCGKECVVCKYTAASDLDLIAHLISSEHMNERKLETKKPTVEYLKTELSNSVKQTNKSDGLTEQTNEEPEVMSKNQRTRLKQKLSQVIKTELSHDLSTNTKISLDKKMQTIAKVLKSPIKPHGSSTERYLSDFTRRFLSETAEKRSAISIWAFNCGLVNLLIETAQTSMTEETDSTTKRSQKCLSLLLELLSADRRVCVAFFYSEHMYSLLEWLSTRWQNLGNSTLGDLLLGLCVLVAVLTQTRKNAEIKTSDAADFGDRLNHVANYLLKSAYLSLHRVFATTGVEPTEIENGRFVRPLDLTTNILTALLPTDDLSGPKTRSILKMSVDAFQALVRKLYGKICTDVVVSVDNDSASTTLMSSSMVSSSSSAWASVSNLDVLLSSLLQTWNSINLFTSGRVEEILWSKSEVKDPLRFVYILILALRSIDSFASTNLSNHLYAMPTVELRTVLLAICHFASTSANCKMLCTLSGPRSLVVHLCRLPFSFLQDESTRPLMMTALVAILYEQPEGVELIRNFVNPSWMSSFLENYVHDRVSNEERIFLNRVFPQTNWSKALEFFSELQ